MRLEDFDFDLPEELIATRPVSPRSSAKLLVADETGLADRVVTDLVDLLGPGDRLVLNNTKVLPARLSGRRVRLTPEGQVEAKVEVTLAEPRDKGQWLVLAKPLRKLVEGDEVVFSEGLKARVVQRNSADAVLAFEAEGDAFETALAEAGTMPLPPYIASKRPADARDNDDYQTVFARHSGAVAAPTASLHFDASLLEALRAKGVAFSEVTLHVGAGTFLPVKVEDVTTHKMHAEWGEVTAEAAKAINRTKAEGGRIIPVGTTALRLIESAATDEGELQPWRAPTDIFIYPGYQWRIADGLMTNFHLPKSTLMMLVSALMGVDRMREVYAHAIAKGYRFFSYGDASLLLPPRR